MDLSFVAVDIEATGLSHRYDSILSIGAVKVKDNEVIDRFYRIVHVTKKFKPFSENIRELAEQSRREGEPYEVVLKDFVDFMEDYPFVAHNVKFDHRFINAKLQNKLGISLTENKFCTIDFAKRLRPGLPAYDLHTVANALGILNLNHHNALNDAEVAADIVLVLNGCEPQATRTKDNSNPTLNLLKALNNNGRGYI